MLNKSYLKKIKSALEKENIIIFLPTIKTNYVRENK